MSQFQSAIPRREILRGGAAALAAVGLGGWTGILRLGSVSAAEMQVDANVVRLDPAIEPVVQLIEQTPRDRLLEEVAGRIRKGHLRYPQLLAALLLAGVRNVQPRPSVGFKFHAVLVVNSAHLASLASPPDMRWLPIFWALDYFKSAASRDVQEGNWTMGPVAESAVPSADKAPQAFRQAMENWDEAAADSAVAGLARGTGTDALFDLFVRYGARDFRSIGHKAIFVANGFRTLQVIGRQHAEPVLRSLAYALLMHEGGNPARRDDPADRPYRQNLERIESLGPNWNGGRIDDGATRELLAALRSDGPEQVCALCVEQMNAGVSPQSLWDAQFVAAGEYLMQQPGIVALHASTTSNALRYAYESAADEQLRQMALLQNAAFLTMFREAMAGRGAVASRSVEDLKGASAPESPEPIFASLNRDPLAAAGQTLAYLNAGDPNDATRAHELIDAARLLVFLKGTDSHDYKFSSAVLEDYYHVSPAWRNQFLAASVFKLHGSGERDNPLVERTRAALGA